MEPTALQYKKTRKPLIIALVIALVIIGGLLFLLKNNIIKLTHKSSITQLNSAPKTVVIFFQPAGIVVSPSKSSYQVDIYATAGKNKVSGIQAELMYDHTYISNVKITPPTTSDSFFGGSGKQIVLINKSNPSAGTLTYAIAITPQSTAATGRGIIGTLSFDAKGPINTETSINFTPKTIVTQENEADSVLHSASPLYIKFSNIQPANLPATSK